MKKQKIRNKVKTRIKIMKRKYRKNTGITMIALNIILIAIIIAVIATVAIIYSINEKNTNNQEKIATQQKETAPSDYIPINNVEDYKKLVDGTFDLSKNYILMNDIDLTNEKCTPIGLKTINDSSKKSGFTGKFDGNNHTITGWNFESNFKKDDYDVTAGFFAYLEGATIKNLTIKNAILNLEGETSNSSGILAGKCVNTYIENCHVEGKIQNLQENDSYIFNNIGLLVGEVNVNLETNNKQNQDIPNNLQYKTSEVVHGLETTNGTTIKDMEKLSGVIIKSSAKGSISNKDNATIDETHSYLENKASSYIGGLVGKITGNNMSSTELELVSNCNSEVSINGGNKSIRRLNRKC